MENIRMRRMGIWSEIISDITAVSAGFFLSMKIFILRKNLRFCLSCGIVKKSIWKGGSTYVKRKN